MQPKEFRRWFEHARAGDIIVYHIGDLSFDRLGHSLSARLIDEMGATAYDFYNTDECHLVQRRLGHGVFEYRAVRTNPRNSAIFDRWRKRPMSAFEIQPIRQGRRPALGWPI